MPIHPHHEWSNPYKYIDKLFADAMSKYSRDVSKALDDLQDAEYLNEAMRDESFVESIPYLSYDTIEGLQSGQLCRYRGLVQDMYGAELYSGAIGAINWLHGTNEFRKVRISKYRDTQRTDYPGISQDLTDVDQDACYKDRSSYLLVPIPGQTPWVRGVEPKKDPRLEENRRCHSSNSELKKRSAAELGSGSAELHDGQKKKAVNDDSHALKSTEIPFNDVKKTSDLIEEERTSNDENESSSGGDNESFTTIAMFCDVDRYCPGIYEGDKEFCCLLKVYDNCDKPLRLNDVIEVVGIYTDDPHIGCRTKWIPGREPKPKNEEDDEEELSHDDGEFQDGYEDVHQDLPRDSMAPRLHCISYRRLGSSYPLLHPVHVPEYAESKADDNLIESTNQSVNLWADQTVTHTAVSSTENKATKEWILNRIAKVLGGDRTAAEYVLLCVLSRTYGRDYTGANLLLGTLSITLNGFTVSDRRIEKLREVLSEFVPLCVKISADISTLNGINMMPERNYDLNRLPLSPLQLARGTVLIIDESGLTEGALTETGNRSVAALKSIALHQKLPIQYPYYELLVPTDLPLIVVTSSPKGNALCGGPNVLLVVLCPVSGSGQKGDAHTSSVSQGSSSAPSHSSTVVDAMEEDRNEAVDGQEQAEEGDEDGGYEEWITRARMWWAAVRMLEITISDTVAAQCVESFAQARQTDLRLAQNAFHQWLTISRLIAISEGAKEITAEHWSSMLALEAVRVDRVHTA